MSPKLNRYPAAYTRILLSLPADGSPIEFTLSSEAAAIEERLHYYNFLKFVRRNPDVAVTFGNRHNEVIIRVKGSTIRFQLRATAIAPSFEAGLNAALAHMTQPATNGRVTELTTAHALDAAPPSIPVVDPEAEVSNVLDTFLKGIGAK